MTPVHARGAPTVQRQIVLPLSKAVEIAWKSIRVRLSRSVLVTSGIVLAVAFLMSIWTTDALVGGMRRWIAQAPQTPAFAALRQRQQEATAKIAELDASIRAQIAAAQPPPADRPRFDPVKELDADFPTLQKELGPLPAGPEALVDALTAQPQLTDALRQWIAAKRSLKSALDQLARPQTLETLMKTNGVPTSPTEIAAGRTQTRWLLALALLVALVGILNAMLMSVTERFREIGTMKCLGALDSFIVKLFLIESLFQGLAGTSLGVLLGLALSLAAACGTYKSYAWENAPWGPIAFSALICMGVGMGLTVAGAVYPAWQAARMQPIEAMRVDA